MNLSLVQSRLRAEGVGGWLIYDFRGSSPVFAQLLPGKRFTTRRIFLWVPAQGAPEMLVQGLDAAQFEHDGIARTIYTGWKDLHAWLARTVAPAGRVAMEYSPGGALPVVGIADCGTVELVRACGVEVVSSANIIQASVALWSEQAVADHAVASCDVAGAKDAAFALIRERVSAGVAVNEYEVQQFILSRFRAAGLEWPDPPIVAVNAHSGDPHFEPSAENPSPIRRGDWVLIDLWARKPGDHNIYSDITWVGFAGETPSARHREVFEAVKAARDAAAARAVAAWKAKEAVQGWQLDEAAMEQIRGRDFGQFIKHRTGHSLSPGPKVHGMGMNLDNLETHDTREMLAGIGFTIEPGIYTPEFGVRLEINMYVDPAKGPVVTSCLQEEIVRCG